VITSHQRSSTTRRFNRSDRHLASILYQRGFSLDLVRSALLLATARRLAHDPTHPLPGPLISRMSRVCSDLLEFSATGSCPWGG